MGDEDKRLEPCRPADPPLEARVEELERNQRRIFTVLGDIRKFERDTKESLTKIEGRLAESETRMRNIEESVGNILDFHEKTAAMYKILWSDAAEKAGF